MDSTQRLIDLLSTISSQGNTQNTQQAQGRVPGLPSLEEVRSLPPIQAPQSGGLISGMGNAILDAGVGTFKGAADLGLGGVDLLRQGGISAGVGLANLTDKFGEMTGLYDISDEKMGRLSQTANDLIDKRQQDVVDMRGAMQESADSMGIGGNGGFVEDIFRVAAPAIGGTSALMRAVPGAVAGLSGKSLLQQGIRTAPYAGVVDAISADSSRPDDLNQTTADLMASLGLIDKDSLLTTSADSSDMANRLKVGIDGALLSGGVGALLTGAGKGIQAVKGFADPASTPRGKMERMLIGGESRVDPNAVRGADEVSPEMNPLSFIRQQPSRADALAEQKRATQNITQSRVVDEAADLEARNPMMGSTNAPAPVAMDELENLLSGLSRSDAPEEIARRTDQNAIESMYANDMVPAVSMRPQSGPLGLPAPVRSFDGTDIFENFDLPSVETLNAMRKTGADKSRNIEKMVAKKYGFSEVQNMQPRAKAPPIRQESVATAALRNTETMSNPVARREAMFRESLIGIEPGKPVPLARLRTQAGTSVEQQKQITKSLVDEGLIRKTNKGYVRSDLPVNTRPFDQSPVNPGRQIPSKATAQTEQTDNISFFPKDDEFAFSKATSLDDIKVRQKTEREVVELKSKLDKRASKYGFKPEQINVVKGWIQDAGNEAAYNGKRKAIYVSTLAKDPVGALDHEIFHALRPGLNRQENRVLERAADGWMDKFAIRERYKDLAGNQTALREEGMAEYFRRVASGSEPVPTGTLKKIYDKVKGTLERTGNFLRSDGFQNADDIMKRLATGKGVDIGKVDGLDDFLKFSKEFKATDAAANVGAMNLVRSGFDLKKDSQFIKNLAKGAMNYGKIAWKSVVDAAKNPKDLKKNLKAFLDALNNHANPVFITSAGAVRAIARRYNIKEMLDLANAISYTRKGGRETFDEISNVISSKYHNRFKAPFDALTDESKIRVGDILAGRKVKNITNAEAKAAKDVREALDDIVKEMKENGIDLGYAANYFPRKWDINKMIANEEDFKAKLAMTFKDKGASKESQDAINQLYEDLTMGRMSGDISNKEFFGDEMTDNVKARFQHIRKLGPDADEILKDYLVSDPVSALSAYAHSVSRKIAFDRNIKKQWMSAEKAMIAARVSADDIYRFKYYTKKSIGMDEMDISNRAKTGLSAFHTIGTASVMSHALFSSLMEPVMAGVRSGSLTAAFDSFRGSLKAVMKTKDGLERREFAKLLGVLSDSIHENVLLARQNSLGDSDFWAKAATGIYKRTGQTGWTDATRVGVMNVGQKYVESTISRAAKGSKAAVNELAQLGIDAKYIDELAGLIGEGTVRKVSKDALKNQKIVLPTAANETAIDAYHRSIRRFVDETVMRPTAATRPAWANNPVGRVMYALTSYMWAFQTNFINRQLARTTEAIRSEKGEFTMAEKRHMIAPMFLLATAWPMTQAVSNEMRYAILDPKRREGMDTRDRVELALSRSGVTGVLDIPFQMITGARYRSSISGLLAGPYGNHFAASIDRAINGTFNQEGSTANQNIARALYDAFILPAANITAAVAPISPIVAASSIYMAPKYGRNAFVGTFE